MSETLWAQIAEVNPISWFAMVTGIIGVTLSIKERASAWPFFILCYCSYIYLSFIGGYYAFFGMNIAFAIFAIYGWAKWSGLIAKEQETSLEITHLPTTHWKFLAVFIISCTFGVGALLTKTGEAQLPYLDAFAASCGFSAQWMLSRKHIENWIFWVISDCIYILIFIKGQDWPTVILFSVFIILARIGWLDWKKSIQNNRPAATNPSP